MVIALFLNWLTSKFFLCIYAGKSKVSICVFWALIVFSSDIICISQWHIWGHPFHGPYNMMMAAETGVL